MGAHPQPDGGGLAEGDVVGGKYRVDRAIGEGGIALVYRAVHVDLHEPVALKFLKPTLEADADVRARFAREARAAVRLKSEYVCRVMDVGTHEGRPYMVMEHLDGRDLESTLRVGGPMPTDVAVEYVIQACAGLAEAHARGIVHRDVKPENIFLVERDGWRQVKLLDFGISKIALEGKISDVDLRSGDTAAIMGSPYYMSPEQLRSTRTVDHRTDLWSLGAVLFEVLTGHTAFKDTHEFAELVADILEQPHKDLRVVRPDAPAGLAAVIDRLLVKDRERRYQSAGEVAVALFPFATKRARVPMEQAVSFTAASGMGSIELPTTVPPPANVSSSPPIVVIPPAPPPPSAPDLTPMPPPPAEAATTPGEPSRRGVWAALAIIVLLLGAVGAWLGTRGRTTPDAPIASLAPTGPATTAAVATSATTATSVASVTEASTTSAGVATTSATASANPTAPPTSTPTTKRTSAPPATTKPTPSSAPDDLEIRRNR